MKAYAGSSQVRKSVALTKMKLIFVNLYAQLDDNKDGFVTVAEFKKAMKYARWRSIDIDRVRCSLFFPQRARCHSRFLRPTLELRR